MAWLQMIYLAEYFYYSKRFILRVHLTTHSNTIVPGSILHIPTEPFLENSIAFLEIYLGYI